MLKRNNGWELSLAIGLLAALVWCALFPNPVGGWWCAAFSPLCDGILSSASGTGEIVLKSRLWELAQGLLG